VDNSAEGERRHWEERERESEKEMERKLSSAKRIHMSA
jgi:hypothetical protein